VADKDTEEARKEIERLAKEQLKREEEAAKKEKEDKGKSKKEIEAAEKQAKKEAERLAKEEAKKKAEDEKRFKQAEARAKKEAGKLAKKQAKQAKQAKEEPAPDVSAATYEGKFQLVLPSSVDFKQVKQFTQNLAGRKDVEVVWTGGSLDEGTLITVSVAQATPLARILSEMPMVGGVEVKGEKITVTLKDSA
jgi:hypothetical protein